jgi:hypothetical protein
VALRLAALQHEINNGVVVENLGATADQLCNDALEAMAAVGAAAAATLDAQLSHLEASVDAPLHVLYVKLLSQFRTAALQQYRAAGTASYGAMLVADRAKCQRATAATQEGNGSAKRDWDYQPERSFSQSVLSLAADASQKATDVQLAAAMQQQTAVSFLQSQQQMIQRLQHWNCRQ